MVVMAQRLQGGGKSRVGRHAGPLAPAELPGTNAAAPYHSWCPLPMGQSPSHRSLASGENTLRFPAARTPILIVILEPPHPLPPFTQEQILSMSSTVGTYQNPIRSLPSVYLCCYISPSFCPPSLRVPQSSILSLPFYHAPLPPALFFLSQRIYREPHGWIPIWDLPRPPTLTSRAQTQQNPPLIPLTRPLSPNCHHPWVSRKTRGSNHYDAFPEATH